MSRAISRGCQFGSSASATKAADGLEDLTALEVGLERLRDADRAVGLLVGLEDRHDRAGDRDQGAVEGRDGLDLRGALGALGGEPAAGVEATGLEVGAVGR